MLLESEMRLARATIAQTQRERERVVKEGPPPILLDVEVAQEGSMHFRERE